MGGSLFRRFEIKPFYTEHEMSQFAELLAELNSVQVEQDTLAKSLPAAGGEDDQAIQAAATDGGVANPEDDDEDDEKENYGKDGKPGKETMAKSLMAIVDGEEVEALDATEMLKSFDSRIGGVEGALTKALSSTLATIKTQGEMIKSLNARLDQFGGQGKGRKTVLTIAEKPAAGADTLAKSQPQGLTGAEFMVKANVAFDQRKLSGQELTTADVALRSGQPVPAEIISKVLS